MSRSGYTEDCDDNWRHIMWRGAVASAIAGRRGQEFLREMLAALDAMPEKKLQASTFVEPSGACCALGAVALKRGIETGEIQKRVAGEWDQIPQTMAEAFGISPALAAEIMYVNDEGIVWDDWRPKTAEQLEADARKRWAGVRQWVVNRIKEPAA